MADETIEKLEKMLGDLQTRLGELRVKKALFQSEVKDRYDRWESTTRSKLGEVKDMLRQMREKENRKEAFEDLRKGAESVLSDLKASFTTAASRFR